MRLVDADALKKDLKSVTLSNGTLVNTNAVLYLLEEYPTAYDVDKVVEQLKTDSSVRLYGSGNSNNYLIPLERAIEIVKAGDNI